MAGKPANERHGYDATHVGADIDGDRLEWLKAIDQWIAHNRRQPNEREILMVAKSLGYRLPCSRRAGPTSSE